MVAEGAEDKDDKRESNVARVTAANNDSNSDSGRGRGGNDDNGGGGDSDGSKKTRIN
jgi:hypothetical protein